ncbi:DNA topoisomerase III [Calorimonas adulescens]|uniref:DNA topoisomerase n=1 Tax=Calorimonas adulescens TaxID=2606906 RepID=A0A5D8Q9R1_9THEO|nr:DNA topoisomerase III [Calorimonas adulescens]TZE80924.1 DNA topoisomerase III [Calorimonas adulescens]
MKSLVLAEKPSVAKEIARVLKCNNKNKGYFEGPEYVVTWALGHLVTLAEPEDYDPKYKEWRLEDLPMLPSSMDLQVIRETSHQFKVVKGLMRRRDIGELVIATDAGREGELVARWIMMKAGWKKPFKRLWISSQTDSAIKEGFKNLRPGHSYDNLYYAAQCRAEADWLIGLNVTRGLACKFNAQLTAGRVQTPTLAMIVDRENEIKNFIPRDFWTVRVDFGEYFGDWRDKNGQGRIFEQHKAEDLISKIEGHTGVITSVNVSEKNEPAPLAYDLTELQRDANRRYSFSAQKTLSLLQSLYEHHKLVTYPRTDSRYISTDIVPTLPGRLRSIAVAPYAEFVKPLLQKPIKTTRRLVDNSRVTDHHAIIPTDQPLNLSLLNSDEYKLYDLIVRRFIAVLYPPYLYEQTTIITEVNGEIFYSTGRIEKDKGWRAVATYSSEKEDSDDGAPVEQVLNCQHRGDKKQVKGCKVNKSKTKPPARYTEATLLTAMEGAGKFVEDEELREAIKQGGLGTPATRAEIIEKLLYNNYVERRGKELVPTTKGIQLIELVPQELRKPELTAQWELRLSNIATGKDSHKDFMEGIRNTTVELVNKIVEQDVKAYRPDNITRTKCPMCGRYMLLVNSRKGRMLVCPERSCGYRQPERQDNANIFKRSRNEHYANQKLIARYSDRESVGISLEVLLKEALKKKGDPN